VDILNLARGQAREALHSAAPIATRISEAQVFAAREALLDIHLAPALERYLVELVLATRAPARYSEELARGIALGASPRGTIALDRCARAFAWLEGRDFVTPAYVHAVAADVLRHRVLVTFEAEAEGFTADKVVKELLERVPLP